MTILSVLGLLILVSGIFLIGFGIQKSQTLTNKVMEGVTGRFTERTMWMLIGGALLALIGATMMYSGWDPSISSHP